jgi:hypothetical protein
MGRWINCDRKCSGIFVRVARIEDGQCLKVPDIELGMVGRHTQARTDRRLQPK